MTQPAGFGDSEDLQRSRESSCICFVCPVAHVVGSRWCLMVDSFGFNLWSLSL